MPLNQADILGYGLLLLSCRPASWSGWSSTQGNTPLPSSSAILPQPTIRRWLLSAWIPGLKLPDQPDCRIQPIHHIEPGTILAFGTHPWSIRWISAVWPTRHSRPCQLCQCRSTWVPVRARDAVPTDEPFVCRIAVPPLVPDSYAFPTWSQLPRSEEEYWVKRRPSGSVSTRRSRSKSKRVVIPYARIPLLRVVNMPHNPPSATPTESQTNQPRLGYSISAQAISHFPQTLHRFTNDEYTGCSHDTTHISYIHT